MNFRLLAFLPLLTTIACQLPDNLLDNPDYQPTYTWDNTDDDNNQTLEPEIPIIAPNAPVLNSLPSTYYYKSIPVRGSAEPNNDILVSSSQKGVVIGHVNNDGSFCVDLPLATNVTQDIKARVHNGLFSEYTTTSITQEYYGDADDDIDPGSSSPAEEFKLTNVALRKNIFSDPAPENGLVNYLTDGEESNSVEFIDSWFGGAVFLWIDLEEVHNIFKVEVTLDGKSGAGYPDEVVVYTSTANSVNSPENDAWAIDDKSTSVAATYNTIRSDNISLVLYGKPEARWVGLMVNFKSNMSDKSVFIGEVKVIIQEEITDPEEETVVNPVEGMTTPSCANGLKI